MTIPEPPPASLRLRIDRQALAANWRALDRLSGHAQAGAAVKADAYGVGIAHALPALLEAGAREFFVAHWSEVPALLAHVPASRISVLHGPVTPQDAAFAQQTGVRPVINSLHQARLWLEQGGGACHLMIDSGINRLGLEPEQVGDPLVGQLTIDMLMSHLASADEDSAQNRRQLTVFRETAAHVPALRASLANSAGIALGSDYHFDVTRPGLALYGGIPRSELAGRIAQVVFPQAAIVQIREIGAGDAVGYNATWVAERPMRVATVSLGYADGVLRGWAGIGALQHDGRALPFLGRVSMDMVVADCSAAGPLKEGDFLEFPYDLAQASQHSGLSQYELLTLLGKRFSRES